ncbi:MAG: hypothetical protein Q3983_01190 [Capnocytophaga sp.]|nr:hypothetical protein [Capnocytophaga sp.]
MKNIVLFFSVFLFGFLSNAKNSLPNHPKDSLLQLSKVVENVDFNSVTKKYSNVITTNFLFKNKNIFQETLHTIFSENNEKANITTNYLYKKDKLYKMVILEDNKEIENIEFLYQNNRVSEMKFTNKKDKLNTEYQKIEYLDDKISKITTIYTNKEEKYKYEKVISYISDTEIQVIATNTFEKDGEKQDNWQTNTTYVLDDNKNIIISVEERENQKEMTTCTYDNKKNPYFYQEHLKIIDPLFFLNEKYTKNNLLTKKIQIIENNDFFILGKYFINYEYNTEGFPTKAIRYVDVDFPEREKLFFY